MTVLELLALVKQCGGGATPSCFDPLGPRASGVIVFFPDELVAFAKALGATVEPDPEPIAAVVQIRKAA